MSCLLLASRDVREDSGGARRILRGCLVTGV